MTSTPDLPQPEGDAQRPYDLLGVPADASFEQVQSARQDRLAVAGDDPIARARIEAAYDAVLMDRLRERQQGRVSTAARSASAREQKTETRATGGPSLPPLPRLPALPALPAAGRLPRLSLPMLNRPEGADALLVTGGGGLLLLLLLLVPSASPELLLALATVGTIAMLQRRSRRFWSAVGWSFGLLLLGLLLGALLAELLGGLLESPAQPWLLSLNPQQVQSLPGLLLLALGALLIA